jgi:predicted nucleotidyltransferase
MKTAGIIAEYNPFHKGHEYQILYAKEKLKADYVIVAMSGDYVQRGTPALISKHARAEMALRCGADLVLEMPVYGKCGSLCNGRCFPVGQPWCC